MMIEKSGCRLYNKRLWEATHRSIFHSFIYFIIFIYLSFNKLVFDAGLFSMNKELKNSNLRKIHDATREVPFISSILFTFALQ